MTDLAELAIYSLPYQAVSPSENAILNALLVELQALREEVAQLREEQIINRQEIEELKSRLRDHSGRLAGLELAQDDLEASLLKPTACDKEPHKTETARAEKICKYLKDRPDHRASFELLKGVLGIDNVRLNEAIHVLMKIYPGNFGIVKNQSDKRKRILTMIAK